MYSRPLCADDALSGKSSNRLPIGRALALDAFEGRGSALGIGFLASVVAEIELTDLALEVLGRYMVVGADQPALGHGEVGFDGVGVARDEGL